MERIELRFITLIIVITCILFAFTACDKNKKLVPPSQMLGTWVGMGRVLISNEYLNQRQMPVMLVIEEDGTITGYIGDASIQQGTLLPAHWWQKLMGKEKYRSSFKLEGFIVNGEKFKRAGGNISFEKIGENELTCSFASDGSQVDSTNIVLTVGDIQLHRQ